MKVRRWWVMSVVSMTAVLGLVTSAGAMTSNAPPDGDGHPAVVALIYRVAPDRAYMFCSGTLITPTVVVTASHCVSAAERYFAPGSVLVSNDPVLTDDPNGLIDPVALSHVSGVSRLVVNPAYKPGVGTDSYREDVSAVVVSDPGALGRPGGVAYPSLPEPGALDALRASGALRQAPVQVMGYGTEEQQVGPGGVTFADTGERRVADLAIAALNPQVIHESQQIHKGSAGACYGDSGGPTFRTLGGTWTILGVTSTGDIPCWATNTASRIDRTSVLEFLRSVTTTSG